MAYLSSCLTLEPTCCERRFWSSTFYRDSTKSLDNWAHYITALQHIVLLSWQPQLHQARYKLRIFRSAFFLAWVAFQRIWSNKAPDSYWKWRPYLLIFNKLVAFLFICVVGPSTARLMISLNADNTILSTTASSSWLALPAALEVAKIVSLVSLDVFVAIDSVNPPLPYTQQIPLYTLHALTLSFLHLHPATHLLQPHAPALTSACHATNTILLLVSGLLASVDISHSFDHLSTECGTHATQIWLVFLNLFAGLVLPIFIAYQVEHHLKQRFVREVLARETGEAEADTPPEGQHSPPAFLRPTDVLHLTLLAMMSWALAMCIHERVAAMAHPL